MNEGATTRNKAPRMSPAPAPGEVGISGVRSENVVGNGRPDQTEEVSEKAQAVGEGPGKRPRRSEPRSPSSWSNSLAPACSWMLERESDGLVRPRTGLSTRPGFFFAFRGASHLGADAPDGEQPTP